jgi:hypothetical protein
MKKDLLALLRKTKPVALKSGVVRTLDDAELASVVGGLASRTDSCSGGCADDCQD